MSVERVYLKDLNFQWQPVKIVDFKIVFLKLQPIHIKCVLGINFNIVNKHDTKLNEYCEVFCVALPKCITQLVLMLSNIKHIHLRLRVTIAVNGS